MIPGVLAGAFWGYLWYYYRRRGSVLVCAGMLSCIGYYMLFYHDLAKDMGLQDFQLPGFCKGLGLALLYISIGVYAPDTFPRAVMAKGIGLMILVRSFLARYVFSGIFTYLLYAGSVRHLNHLAGLVDRSERYRFHGSVPGGGYLIFMQRQAYLAAAKELTGVLIVMGLAIVIFIVLYSSVIKNKKKYEQAFRTGSGPDRTVTPPAHA
ncbi:MAG TPA: hypothetical protein VL727_22835 [Puia sp.]|nr:hypothetical protein [Puia sp.]